MNPSDSKESQEFELADHVASAVNQKFNSICKNHVGYTVLAGIVLLPELECIALGTGLKCLPPSKIPSTGLVVIDSHAEIICKRNFNRYLLNQIQSFKRNHASIIKAFDNGKAVLKDDVKFAFYTSQAPCGDASMIQLAETQTTESLEKFEQNRFKRQKLSPSHEGGLESDLLQSKPIRGRLGYENLGKTRTKPARIDAETTLCMSCSDKISKWQSIGFGSLVDSLFGMLKFEFLVVGDQFHPYIFESLMNRCKLEVGSYKSVVSPVYPTKIEFKYSKSQFTDTKDIKPSNSSISYTKGEKHEVIIKGLKQGSKTATIKTTPSVSKYSLGKLYLSVIGSAFEGDSYKELKQKNNGYQTAKSQLYEKYLSWTITSNDDFLIP